MQLHPQTRINRRAHLNREDQMHSSDYRRSPFFSTGFLKRLQKMIRTERGRATELEQAIERVLQRISAIFAARER
jgi:hypothetical protein